MTAEDSDNEYFVVMIQIILIKDIAKLFFFFIVESIKLKSQFEL